MAQSQTLLGVTNHGGMTPLFVLVFPISEVVSPNFQPQGESLNQLLYWVP